MMRGEVQVIGGGGHAKVVVRALLDLGCAVRAVFDDDPRRWGTELLGCPVCGPIERIRWQAEVPTVIAIGQNELRQRIAAAYDLDWATVVHPSALVDPTVELGPGSVVLQRAVIQADSRIGSHAIVNTAATVDHDCLLGDFVHVAPGTHLAGGVTLGPGVLLGIGAVAVPGAVIGEGTVVGAGAAVVGALPAHVVAHGVPARVARLRERISPPTPPALPAQAAKRRAA